MADSRLKLAQGLRNLPDSARQDLAQREEDMQRGKTVELLRRAGKEMYENPVVNTAIGLAPGAGDLQSAYEAINSAREGNYGEAGLNALGVLPFIPSLGVIGKTVWHGSPHSFEKFDLSKIGTGEGAQAYGHGLYLAESPKTAEQYQKGLSDFTQNVEGAAFNPDDLSHRAALSVFQAGGDKAKAIKTLEDSAQSLGSRSADWAKNLAKSNLEEANYLRSNESIPAYAEETLGSLYKVDLPDEQIAKMLDWDKPLSEQAPEIQELARNLDISNAIGRNKGVMQAWREGRDVGITPRGEHLYESLAGSGKYQPQASQTLYEAGIPGIQYLDQASRGAGEGTRNYVVFSDEIPQILERNGQPVAQALRNYESPKQATLQDVVSPIEQRGVTLDVYESNKKPLMTLSRIEVPKEMRGQGVGTQAMQDLVNYANQQGKTIALSPSTDFGGTSVNRLKDFYKQFGFVENKGRNKDFEISESMYRLPETE